jgi:hypothetical protein
MSKDPAVLFYTSDFLSGTSFFSMAERGQYITLLCEQHQLNSIPEKHLLEVCGSLICQVALKFKRDTDGTYYNERMRLESNKRKAFCQSRRESIEKRYIRSTHVEHTKVRMENENEDRIINKVKKEIKEKNIIPPPFELVQSYCEQRGTGIDAQSFIDHYEARGWEFKRGQKMKDWQAAVRTWEKNGFNRQAQNDKNTLGPYERLN